MSGEVIRLDEHRERERAADVHEASALFEDMLRGALDSCLDDYFIIDPTGILAKGFIDRCGNIGKQVLAAREK